MEGALISCNWAEFKSRPENDAEENKQNNAEKDKLNSPPEKNRFTIWKKQQKQQKKEYFRSPPSELVLVEKH